MLMKLIDRLWLRPDIKSLYKSKNNWSFLVDRFSDSGTYFRSLITDVEGDDPVAALKILEENFEKYKGESFLKYRKAYLLARAGNISGAKVQLKRLDTKKAKLFSICLEKIPVSFTMSNTLLFLSERFFQTVHIIF